MGQKVAGAGAGAGSGVSGTSGNSTMLDVFKKSQSPLQEEEARLKREKEEEEKKIEQERIEGERARFAGGGGVTVKTTSGGSLLG